jgi:hypothetical protein
MSDRFDDLPQRNARIEHVQFAGDEIIAVVLEGEGVAVPILLVCTALGIDSRSQIDRLRGHDVLAQALRFIKVPLGGRLRSVVSILHTHIAFWLATITPSQVNEAVRPKLVRYQQELVVVLGALYGPQPLALPTTTQQLPAGEASIAPLPSPSLPAVVEELRAMRDTLLAAIRGNQTVTKEVADLSARMQSVEDVVEELRQIVPVTPAQAAYLQQTIKALAQRVQQRTRTTHNTYERLFAQFKLDMGIPRYDALPSTRYDDALAWLRHKAQELLPNDPDALPPLQETLL